MSFSEDTIRKTGYRACLREMTGQMYPTHASTSSFSRAWKFLQLKVDNLYTKIMQRKIEVTLLVRELTSIVLGSLQGPFIEKQYRVLGFARA